MEPMPIQFDPRVGMAWAVNPNTVIRIAGGSFHDGTGGAFGQQGDAQCRLSSDQDDLLHRLRLVFERRRRGISGAEYERTGADGQQAAEQPPLHGGDSARNREERRRRCRVCRRREASTWLAAPTSTRSRSCAGSIRLTKTRRSPANAANPGALPDAFLRPILGYSDILRIETSGWQTYDSLQLQVTRRFTGRFEMAGSYTWATRIRGHLRAAEWCRRAQNRRPAPEH